jgi:hypothetical protein
MAEHLAYFRKWLELRAWTDAPPPDEIRQGSVLLRRLLLDRELVRAWQSAGFDKEPQIVAVDLAATVAAQGPGVPEFALAGSTRSTEPNVEGIAALQTGRLRPRSLVRAYSLSEYLESPSIFLGRTTVARREVIKYLAHATGAPAATSSKGRKKEQEFAAHMERIEAKANSYRSNVLQLELFSIGQSLAQAPDTGRLSEALARKADSAPAVTEG